MEWRRLFGRQGSDGSPVGGGEIDSTAPTRATTAQNPVATGPSGGGQDTADGTGTTGSSGNRENSSGGTNRVITFELARLEAARVLDPESNPNGMGMISWKTRNDSVSIETIIWKVQESTRRDGYQDIAREGVDGQEPIGLLIKHEDFADLNLTKFTNDPKLSRFEADNMVLDIQWLVDGHTGHSTSGVFTVGPSTGDNERIKTFLAQFDSASEDSALFAGYDTLSQEGGSNSGTSTSAVPSISTTNSMGPTSVDSPDNSSGSKGGVGLSTGAIAGIAVAGAVVLLALIGGLIFWMLRRRRREQNRGQYNKPATSATFVGGDKENHQVAESPHSSSSNDQEATLSNLGGPGASPRDLSGYAPYRDNEHNAESSATVQRTDGAGTPHGVSRSVAHLVEEGMTEDEIRRLEEEERQLDDAIQRHGQGR